MLTKREPAPTPGPIEFRDPFAFLRRMTSDLDRFFERPASWAYRPRWTFERKEWTPDVELFEKDHGLVARFDLPGMKKEEINVEILEGQLVVSGERKYEEKEEKEGFYRCEHEYGSFYRSIPLPEGAKTEGVTASLANGVLEVKVPLAARPEATTRKVEITEFASRAKAA